MADPTPFAKDFGYLIPFLEKVQAHAATLEDGPTKAELQGLLGGQVQEWSRVQALLTQAGGGEPAPKGPDTAPKAAAPKRASEAASPPVAPRSGGRQAIPGEVGIGDMKAAAPAAAPRSPWTVGSSLKDPHHGSAHTPGSGLSIGSLVGQKRGL